MSAFRNLFARNAVERDLDQELRSYVELLTEEKIKAGLSPDEARRAARLEAGSIEHIKDEVRDVRKGSLLDSSMQDFTYGLRLLRRSPGFTILAVLTIGLGIGANSAIFSVINGVVRKPLAYPDADKLMFITSQFPTLNFNKFWMSPPEYFDYREHTKAFAHLGAYSTGAMNLSEGDRPERVNAAFITASMFDVLGVRPMRGTAFTPEQDRPGADPVVLLSHEIWTRAFAADPAIVGKTAMIQGRQRTILGVMPPGFDLHDSKSQLWIPLGLNPENRQNRGSHGIYVVGRLADNVTPAQANSELQGFLKQWGQWWPQAHVPNDSTHRVQMEPLRDEVVGNVRRALWVLQGAVALVLLIACANVANLLLARAESRHKEFAVRTALGASKARILRQFMTEGTVLSVMGAALGLALAFWGLKALLAANPESVPRAREITLDPVVLAFTVGVALLTGLIFGLAPLLHMGDQAVSLSIKEGGVRSTAGSGRNRVRRGLVVAEIALAVMLVIGAGLLIRTFKNLTSVDAGFDIENRITFGIVLPQALYPDSQRVVQVITDLTQRIDELPGVERVAGMTGLPPQRPVNANDTDFEGYTPAPGDPPENVDYFQTVTNGYFETMGIRIVKGRAFGPADAIGAPVAIINETLARRFFKDTDPLGRRIVNPFFSQTNPQTFTIVGVARDVKQGGLEAPAGTELYFNFEQLPRLVGFASRTMNVVVETSRTTSSIAADIRKVVNGIDPGLPIVQLRTMDDVVGASLVRQKFLSLLLGIFAGVALLLAAIGTYGVLSYMVSERHREIGIRMALGAGNSQVVGLVLRQGITIAVIGIVVGVAGALALSRITQTLLFGVDPADPLTFGIVIGVIALVATAACLIPMRRATRVDPLTAIRAD